MTDRDPVVRRILGVVASVGLSLLVFYGILAVQAYRWSPTVYVKNMYGPRSKTVLDPNAPAWRLNPVRPSAIARGRESYDHLGCAVCHGVGGKGGVTNPNYMRETFPQLNNISTRLFLRDADSHAEALAALEKGIDLDEDEDLEIEMARVVGAQYRNVVNIILNGNPAQKKQADGVDPIPMPAWGEKISEGDARDIVAYLVSLQDLRVFQEEEEE